MKFDLNIYHFDQLYKDQYHVKSSFEGYYYLNMILCSKSLKTILHSYVTKY